MQIYYIFYPCFNNIGDQLNGQFALKLYTSIVFAISRPELSTFSKEYKVATVRF